MSTIGTKAQVLHGTADKTSGGLEKKHLKKTCEGRIVSKKQSKALNPYAKAWSEATKKVMSERKKGDFQVLKKGKCSLQKSQKGV